MDVFQWGEQSSNLGGSPWPYNHVMHVGINHPYLKVGTIVYLSHPLVLVLTAASLLPSAGHMANCTDQDRCTLIHPHLLGFSMMFILFFEVI